MVIRYWLFVIGYSLLVIGGHWAKSKCYWLLVIRYWLLADTERWLLSLGWWVFVEPSPKHVEVLLVIRYSLFVICYWRTLSQVEVLFTIRYSLLADTERWLLSTETFKIKIKTK